MRRTALLAVAVLLAAACQATTAAAEQRRGSQEPKLLLSGRFAPGASGRSGQARLPQLMTWGASSATVRFTGASAVSVTLDGRPEAAPRAHAWVYQARRDAPIVFFQVG